MTIADDQIVKIEYALKNAAGEVLESSKERGPLTFRMGDERLLPGLANVLHGLSVGESKTGTIPAGQLVPADRTPKRRVPRDEFPEGTEPQLGDRFEAHDTEGHPVVFEVFESDDDAVMVHLLHPLHDEELHYEVTVLSARQPAPDEAD